MTPRGPKSQAVADTVVLNTEQYLSRCPISQHVAFAPCLRKICVAAADLSTALESRNQENAADSREPSSDAVDCSFL